MIQLWAWEYNGQDEVGIKSVVDKQELFRTDDFYSLATQHSRRTIGQVTNLRKVKVVDVDAVVIDLSEYDRTNVDTAMKSIALPTPLAEIIAKIYYAITLTPPVLEPTGFGAIVKADMSSDQNRQMFVKNLLWFRKDDPERGFLWNSLQNPVVISEGQK